MTAVRVRKPVYPLDLLWNLTLRELRGKYKRSILGWGWSVINPIVQLAVYSFVFGVLFKSQPPPGDPSGMTVYAFFLVSAFLPWVFHQNAVMGALTTLSGNGNLIRKVYFPRSILPFASSLSWLVTFAVEMSVLLFVLAVFQSVKWQVVPLIVLASILLMFFSLGVGLVASAVNVYFRDVEYLTMIGLQVWFWATPVVYSVTLVTQRQPPLKIGSIGVITLYKLNPMYHYVESFRDMLYNQRYPGWDQWGIMVGCAALSMLVGALVFRKVEPRMAEEL